MLDPPQILYCVGWPLRKILLSGTRLYVFQWSCLKLPTECCDMERASLLSNFLLSQTRIRVAVFHPIHLNFAQCEDTFAPDLVTAA